MKKTTIKISVTQDGLLPEEVTLLGKIFIPPIQKQILRSTGFEKIDDSTYAGVMPVKIIANAKVQEIEFEIGAIPDFRKKVVEFVNVVSLQDFIEPEPEPVVETKKKLSKSKKEKEEKKEAAKAKAKAKKIVGTSPLKSKAKKAATKKAVAKANIAKKAAAKKSLTKKVVKKAAVKATAKKATAKKATAKKVTAKKAAPKKVTKVKNKTKRK